MRKYTLWCVVIVAVLLSEGAYVHADPILPWDEFLRDPNPKGLAALENTIAASHKPCGSSTKPSLEQETLLFELIRQGNSAAFQAALAVSRCFGVADSEDFHRSAGVFLELRPLVFLKSVRRKAIQDSELRYLFTALPLDLPDREDIDVLISAVENRISILNSIDDPSVTGVKKKGLQFLKEDRKQLLNTRIDMHKERNGKNGAV
jgi:hypothetical protein